MSFPCHGAHSRPHLGWRLSLILAAWSLSLPITLPRQLVLPLSMLLAAPRSCDWLLALDHGFRRRSVTQRSCVCAVSMSVPCCRGGRAATDAGIARSRAGMFCSLLDLPRVTVLFPRVLLWPACLRAPSFAGSLGGDRFLTRSLPTLPRMCTPKQPRFHIFILCFLVSLARSARVPSRAASSLLIWPCCVRACPCRS